MRNALSPARVFNGPVTSIILFVVLLLAAGCGGGATPTSSAPAPRQSPAAPPTQPAAVQQPSPALPTQPAAQPTRPAPQPTQPPTPIPTAPPTARPATTTAGRFANPDTLNSYRMKTTTWEKGGDKSRASVILTEWVKATAAKRTVIGDIETITIGDKTWAKIMGRWVQQDRATPQPQGSDLSASIMRQVEDKFVYKEVGRETVNGVACKKYTYSGEATMQIAEGALKGEATVRGQGEMWVADQASLPPVAVRSRGESEIRMKAPAGMGAAGEINLAMNTEMELYDINTPITITPPTDVFTPPTPPAGIVAQPTATRGAVQTLQPGLASLTPIPELKACFDSFPLPASVKPDAETAGVARIVAAGLGSPSEARGYLTTDPVAQAQQFIEKQALAAGWELGTMMQGQNVQYWTKDQFFIVLNIFPPSGNRKETAIALACGKGRGSTSAATATPIAATTAAPASAGTATSFDFNTALDRSWYGQGGVDAEISVEARPGYLRFTAGSGNDLFPATNFDAPTRYRIVNGDFTLETAVEFDPTEDYQGAGLFIWQDESNFVRLERCFGGLGGIESGICFLKVAQGESEAVAAAGDILTTAPRVELRLQKLKNRIAAWWRAAATAPWQPVGNTTIELPGGPQPMTQSALQAGIVLCVEQGAAQINADFDYFRITR